MTTTELHRIRREYVAAMQGERIATAQLLKANAGPRPEEIQAARAETEARQQAASLARRQLEKGTLKAPFTGLIERRFADPGSYNSLFPRGGIPIVQLIDMQTIDAVVSVPEGQRTSYAVGDPIQIASATRPEVQATGKVVSLGRTADAGSGTYSLRVRVVNQQGLFTGGMVVTAAGKVSALSATPTILIPLNSVRRAFAQAPYVLMVETDGADDKVVARDVELGAIRGDLVPVNRGLTGGERLIVRGQHLVVAGDHVRQRQSQAASVAKK
jgi:RND family efflux transporter MFP subunit